MKIYFPDSRQDALEWKISELAAFECWIVLECCYKVHDHMKYFLVGGDRTLGDFLSRLTCAKCKGRPKTAMLDYGCYFRAGFTPDWHRIVLIEPSHRQAA